MAARRSRPPKDRSSLDARRDRAIDLVRNGSTYTEAATAVVWDKASVAVWCRRAGVKLTDDARKRSKR